MVLFFIVVASDLAPISLPFSRSFYDDQERVQLLCVDAEGKHLEGARVEIREPEGAVVYSGLTNSTGWVSTSVSAGSYVVRVYWMGVAVSSKDLFVTGPATVTVQCDVYHLTIAINLLYFIPVRHANITIVNATSHKAVDGYSGEIEIPYGFYRLSAEKTFRLPPGNYTVIVEMLNSQSQNLVLNRSERLVFAYVTSYGSIFILICILAAVISCIGFLVTGRKRTKKNHNL